MKAYIPLIVVLLFSLPSPTSSEATIEGLYGVMVEMLSHNVPGVKPCIQELTSTVISVYYQASQLVLEQQMDYGALLWMVCSIPQALFYCAPIPKNIENVYSDLKAHLQMKQTTFYKELGLNALFHTPLIIGDVVQATSEWNINPYRAGGKIADAWWSLVDVYLRPLQGSSQPKSPNSTINVVIRGVADGLYAQNYLWTNSLELCITQFTGEFKWGQMLQHCLTTAYYTYDVIWTSIYYFEDGMMSFIQNLKVVWPELLGQLARLVYDIIRKDAYIISYDAAYMLATLLPNYFYSVY